ncbi:MAG TPA: glycosyltransferase family 39 protein [Anaerolineales bacterium]|nr:glycosyltransferase family 39 protein [Anaerolineales bacterium]HLO28984.1 glycosyltransferase family 39 protein [Anaerolineales bacterium]
MNYKIVAILFLAFCIRLLGIASRPIWYDEAFAILFSEKGVGAMLYGTLAPTGAGSADIHPLGYYTLLWLWMKPFGESLLATRLLSISAGLVSVYLVYLIALEAFSDTRTAYLSMLFAGLAPFQIHYAQEIRMYSFLALWLLLATYAYQRGSKTANWKWWCLFSISAALAQYTHNLAAFYLVALAFLPILEKDWKALRAMALAGVGALILYSPWAVQLPAQFSKIQSAYWVARPDISKLFTLLLVYITNTPVPVNLIAAALAMALLIVTIGCIQTVKGIRRTSPTDKTWVLYLSVAPPLLLFLFSQWKPVYIERALLPSGAIFCIWLAWVIVKTSLTKAVQYVLFSLVVIAFGLGIYQHVTYRDFPYGPFKELDLSLKQRLETGDVIVHSNKLSMIPAMLFDRDLAQSYIGDPPGSSTDTLAPATQQVLNIRAEKDIRSATGNATRVWYIIFQRSIEEYKAGGHSTHPDLEYLDSQYDLQLEESWDGLKVFLYAKKP